MIKIKKYEDWSSEITHVDESLSSDQFIQTILDCLDNHDFTYELVSSKVQLKHGTVVLMNIQNKKFLKEKMEQFQISKLPLSHSGKHVDMESKCISVDLRELIIYGHGNAKWSGSSSYAFHFRPHDSDGFIDVGIPFLKKILLRKMGTEVVTLTDPPTIKCHSSLKGYPLPEKTLDLIENDIKDIRFFNGSVNSLRKFYSMHGENYVNPCTPFLVLGYLAEQAGFSSSMKIYCYNDGNYTLYLHIDRNSIRHVIQLEFQKSFSLSKDFEKFSCFCSVTLKYNYAEQKSWEEFIQHASPFEDLAKIAIDPKNVSDLEKIAHQKRGTLKGREFGF